MPALRKARGARGGGLPDSGLPLAGGYLWSTISASSARHEHGVLELLVYVVWFVVHHGLMTCDWCAGVVRCLVVPPRGTKTCKICVRFSGRR